MNSKKFIPFLFSFIIVVVFLIIGSAIFSGNANAACYSEGVRQGVVQKFSSKGLINKSWEGEMVQAGVRSKSDGAGGNNFTNIWKFSVTNSVVAKKMEDAMFNGGNVTVKYCQSFFRNPLATNTSYEITDVRGQ